jgi:ABC-type cobalamin/Fe3+-siderophores transport system ATPase subunit
MRARDNPFRTELMQQVRYRFADVTWPEILRRCEALKYRAALIGPHGSGKTTLLEDLEPRLNEHGFGTCRIRLDEEQPRFAAGLMRNLFTQLTSADILLFDGAEQLNLPAWGWFKWQARNLGGLIITTHEAGRLPTLFECKTSPELLAGIAADLLQAPVDTVETSAKKLFQKHRGNVREALREWYDLQSDLK